MNQRPEIPVFILSLVALLGIIGLSIVHVAVPNVLNEAVLATLVGGAAVTQAKGT